MCPHGKFKSETGDGQCEQCPEHSKALDYGLTECRCNNGYYRAKKDPKSMACTRKLTLQLCNYLQILICNHILYVILQLWLLTWPISAVSEPPSAPQNLTVNFVDQSTVILSWSPPQDLGGRLDTVYRMKCDACTLGIVQYTPSAVSNYIIFGKFVIV